jgi:hypothetical protein
MKIVHNTGNDRVIDLICGSLQTGHKVDVATQALSLFASRGDFSTFAQDQGLSPCPAAGWC